MADRDRRCGDRALQVIWVVWFLAGLFGDEVVGVALFGLESEALLMSFLQRWWWVYEGVLFALVCLSTLVVKGICSSSGRADR